MCKLEIQVSQIASAMGEREQGKLPSQPQVNSRPLEEAKAIIILRNRKAIDTKDGVDELCETFAFKKPTCSSKEKQVGE